MSNASGNTKRAADRESDPDRSANSDVSGERPAMQHEGYAGLSSLGSEAFRAPLPPPESEPPRLSSRARVGLYLLGAAVGASLGVVGVALVLKGAAHSPSEAAIPQAPAQADSEPVVAEAVVAPAPAPEMPVPTKVAAREPAVSPQVREDASAAAQTAPSATAPAAAAPAETNSASHRSRADGASHTRRRQTNLPAGLSREQVIAAMTRVQPAVAACFAGRHGSATANVTVIGRTGRVTTAQVSGQEGQVGSCIARAVRGASFPHFADESLTLRYPFAR